MLSNEKIIVRYGIPLLYARWATVKTIATIFYLCFLIMVIFSFRMFISSVQIRNHIGHFINMVSDGDGDVLPSLQAVPVLFCLVFNTIMAGLVFRSFDSDPRPNLNRFMFFLILISLAFFIIIFIIIIAIIAHIYNEHGSLHDGIRAAMENYLNDLQMKVKIDQLQIEFQCCGSRKYDEWYNIKWYDSSLFKTFHKKEAEISTTPSAIEASDGDTPFSCCSMKSVSPCIHHHIEITGKSYLYTPEYNLSISTRGCYDILLENKQHTGWIIVGNLFALIALQIIEIGLFRFIQTAHFINSKYDGAARYYPIWLIGCYRGRIRENYGPKVPPIPDEFR